MMNTETQRHRDNDGIYRELTGAVIASAIDVHRELGPGLFESVYEECFCRELTLRQIPFRRQIDLPVIYKGLKLDRAYRLDIGGGEAHRRSESSRMHLAGSQSAAPLRLTGTPVGLLINFNSPVLKDGIVRRVL